MDYRRNGEPSPALSSLSTQDMDYPRMSTLDTKDECTPPALSFQHYTMLAQQSSPTPAMSTNFMAYPDAPPWNFSPFPFLNTGPDTLALPPLAPAPEYYGYRSAASVSAASDSGYVSLSRSLRKPYMDDISSIGEETFDPEMQRISSQFGQVGIDWSDTREADVPAATNPVAPGKRPRTEFQCEYCHEIVKTQSLLKKHYRRHTKPFLCVEPGCPRPNDGFGTQNDLVRHQRSVHKDLPYTSGKQYRCTLDKCQDKFKIWPRSDNFRNHLRAVHGVPAETTKSKAYLDHFLYRLICEDGEDLRGVTGGPTESELDLQGLYEPVEGWSLETYPIPGAQSAVPGVDHEMGETEDLRLDLADDPMSAAVAASRGPAIPHQVQETVDRLTCSRPALKIERPEDRYAEVSPGSSQELSQMQGLNETAAIVSQLTYHSPAQPVSGPGPIDRSNGGEDSGSAFAGASSLAPHSRRQVEASVDADTCSIGPSDLASSSTSSSGTKRKRPETTQIEDEPQREEKMMKMLDEIPTDLLARYLKEKGISSDADTPMDGDDSGVKQEKRPAQKHQCPDCGRSFGRNSELNKHMRRHEKPYGCTFPGCNRPFGSKSDWRRHESSQHSQLEMWKCDEPIPGGGTCPKASRSCEVFEWHLWNDHEVRDDAEREARMEGCRVHRGSVERFWCGFCREVVIVDAAAGKGAWRERYDHIGNHFTGSHGFVKGDIEGWCFGDLGLGDEMGEVGIVGVRGKRKREGEEGVRVKKSRGGR